MSVYWIIYLTGFFFIFVTSIILMAKCTDFNGDLIIAVSLFFAIVWFGSIIIIILYPVYKFILKIISKIRK